jgi:hypothetical protein
MGKCFYFMSVLVTIQIQSEVENDSCEMPSSPTAKKLREMRAGKYALSLNVVSA